MIRQSAVVIFRTSKHVRLKVSGGAWAAGELPFDLDLVADIAAGFYRLGSQ